MKPVDDLITGYKNIVDKIDEKYDYLTVAQIKHLTANLESAWTLLLGKQIVVRGNDRRSKKS